MPPYPRSKPHAVEWPLTAEQVANVDAMLEELYDDNRNGNVAGGIQIDASQIISGVLVTARGGTNRGSWSPGSVVFVDAEGDALTEDPSGFAYDAAANAIILGDGAAPSGLVDEAALYADDVSGTTTLFARSEAAFSYRLTAFQPYDPGTLTVPTANYLVIGGELRLSGTEVLTLQGDARAIVV